MSEKTKISWCDSTVNFWSGCAKVSAGCAHCYAEQLSNRRLANRDGVLSIGKWGPGAARKLHESAFTLARRLNHKPWVCDGCGESFKSIVSGRMTHGECRSTTYHRRRIFSLSLGDLWDPEVETAWRAEALEAIYMASDCAWLLCSKRYEEWFVLMARVLDYVGKREGFPKSGELSAFGYWLVGWVSGKCIPQNVVLLASVENQATADKRVPELLRVPAACRGLSLEPLLEPVDIARVCPDWRVRGCGPDWLIIGGESGPQARPCNVDWIRSLVEQGRAAGVPVFVKQLGVNHVDGESARTIQHPKGGDPDEWPEDLRVRQWPKWF